jgi:hypothetical protein
VLGHFDVGPQSELLFDSDNEAPRLELSQRMMGYWAEFARSGQPGRGTAAGSPEWSPWRDDPGAARLMVFDTPAGGGLRMADERVTREEVLALMEAEPLDPAARCALFRATFRLRRDPWADEAWKRFADGRCEGERVPGPAARAANPVRSAAK